MYHGVPYNSELIALVFAIIVWIIRSISNGIKRLNATKTNSPLAPPRSQTPPPASALPRTQALLPKQGPPPSQKPPVRTTSALPRERQPSAGGPAVFTETTRRDFERQEQDLFASEPTAMDTPLGSVSTRPTTQPNSLFSGTDDLVRAIILQEVLGPPLSRRSPKPTPPTASPQ